MIGPFARREKLLEAASYLRSAAVEVERAATKARSPEDVGGALASIGMAVARLGKAEPEQCRGAGGIALLRGVCERLEPADAPSTPGAA